MSEADAIERVGEPVTVSSLVDDLRTLGIGAGDVLLVHSSLSALGWVCGGSPTVVDALCTAVTDTGAVVMPTHTGYTDPVEWSNPPVPDEWIEPIRETMPAYRPAVTPTRGVGAVPECFRNYPGVHRSAHPAVSFAAWGAGAKEIVADHALDYGLGENSPLARLYDRDGKILLLGASQEANTSLHLAEHRATFSKEVVRNGGPVLADGERTWVEYETIDEDTEDFADVGRDFERRIGLEKGEIGAATARLMSQRELVDFATEWFEANR